MIAMAGIASGATLFPNGDFNSPAGAKGPWVEASGAGSFLFSYPTTGGNPNGYGIIDNTGGGEYGLWVGGDLAPYLTLSSLGLTAGRTYTFVQDMKIISGPSIGGLKIEFYKSDGSGLGNTGDMRPPSGTASWVTYSFSVTIPANTAGIKVVPLWGPNSSVGYDNIGVIVPALPPLSLAIASGTVASWSAINANSYQPQKSADNSVWTDFGSLISGNSVTSRFDRVKSPFYRVLEVTPGGAASVVTNSGFEIVDVNLIGAMNWNIAVQPNAGASMFVTNQYPPFNAHGGSRFLFMESTTPAVGPVTPPNTDVRSDFFPVTAGTTYDVAFYAAHPVKSGGANPQYHLFFYDSGNAPVGGPTFTSFASVGSTWTKVVTTAVPPAGATQMTIGWIQAMGADTGGDWVTLIDDVSVTTGPLVPGSTNVIAAAVQPGIQVSWVSTNGVNYQVQSTANLNNSFLDFGGLFTGNGTTNSVADAINGTAKFYRVHQTQ